MKLTAWMVGRPNMDKYVYPAIYTNVSSGNAIFFPPTTYMKCNRYPLWVANWKVTTPNVPTIWKGLPYLAGRMALSMAITTALMGAWITTYGANSFPSPATPFLHRLPLPLMTASSQRLSSLMGGVQRGTGEVMTESLDKYFCKKSIDKLYEYKAENRSRYLASRKDWADVQGSILYSMGSY